MPAPVLARAARARTLARSLALPLVLASWLGALGGPGSPTAARADTAVLPHAARDVEQGATAFSPFFSSTNQYTYMLLVDHSVLAAAGVTSGSLLTGISFRLEGAQTADSPAVTYTDFEIYIGASAFAAADASATYASNYAGTVPAAAQRTQVRDGALSLAAGYFPNATDSNPNPFSLPIAFSTGYQYDSSAGSGLVLEFRRSASSGGVNYVDAIPAAASEAGGLRAIHNTGVAGQTATSGAVGAPVVVSQVTFTAASVVPEPGTAGLLALGLIAGTGVVAVRRRRSAP